MKIFLTGRPGVGKSTVLMKIAEELRKRGKKVGGFVTPEIVENGKRVGFYVKDLLTNEMEVFASVDFKVGKKLGRYVVDTDVFERIALKALDRAIEESDVILVDEIGKMEMFSEGFKKKIGALMLLDKKVVAVLHRKLVKEFSDFGEVIEVKRENRGKVVREVLRKIG